MVTPADLWDERPTLSQLWAFIDALCPPVLEPDDEIYPEEEDEPWKD